MLFLKLLKHGGSPQISENANNPLYSINDRHYHLSADWQREAYFTNFLEVGPCKGAGQWHFLHEQYRTADRPIRYRDQAEADRRFHNKVLSVLRTSGGYLPTRG